MPTIPSPTTYLSFLRDRCKCIRSVTHAHTFIHEHFPLHHFLCDFLIMTLAKCGAIDASLQMMSSSLQDEYKLSIFSWTSVISACAGCGRSSEALELHNLMLTHGVEPDKYTFVSLFKACAKAMNLEEGKRLHDVAGQQRPSVVSDVFVCNSLISMYGKCGACHEAEEVFLSMPSHTTVSWNAMLTAYLEQKEGKKALMLYRQMKEERGANESILTTVIALQACCALVENEDLGDMKGQLAMSLEIGKALHAHAYGRGYTSDIVLGSTLISLYGKCGCLFGAVKAFTDLPMRNVVTWTAMISVYVEHDLCDEALQLFKHMHMKGVGPNHLTYVLALRACNTIAEKKVSSIAWRGGSTILRIGRALHADARQNRHASDTLVCNKLISVYGKCKAILEAEQVFNTMPERDVFSWNAMLALYTEQDQVEKVSHLYQNMRREHATVDEVSFMCILQACGKAGNFETCHDIYFCIVSAGYDVVPSVMATLIHAYGGCGSSDDGNDAFDGLIEPDIVLWNACINSHAGEGNHVVCCKVVKELLLSGIKHDKVTQSSILSAFCHIGLVSEGLEYFNSMKRGHYLLPDIQHYGIMFDLLGRAGDFDKVENMLQRMPMKPDMIIWSSLLGACYNHGNLEFAKTLLDN